MMLKKIEFGTKKKKKHLKLISNFSFTDMPFGAMCKLFDKIVTAKNP